IGTRMYEDPTPWLIAGPYRLYETPQEAKSYLPMFYADFLPIPGHPEFDGWFFDCYTEIRNVAPIRGDWSPNNDVAASTDRGIRHLKRGLDSLVLATLWTHEKYLAPISAANWRAIMQGVTNGLAAYKPVYVTLDYANQYVRATRTSRLVESTYDPASGQLVVTLTGKTDLDTLVHVFVDQSQALNPSLVTVPQFSGATTITAATLPAAPVILSPPESRTNLAGSSASFAVSAAGTAPLSYRWLKNQTNRLSDGGKIQGAISATLTLSNVLGGDAGTYSVVVSNSVGSLTSAPAAALTVIDPVITAQPLSRTNHAGSAATFRVETCGTPPVYQWQKDGAPLSGATWSTLTLPAVTAANAGAYSVLVSNTYGSRNSLTAELKVVSPPVVESTALSDSIFTMSWSAIAGQSYRLQYKDNLEQTNWYEWLPDRTASGPVVTVTNSVDNWTQRFYRVLLVP
ncbi:MAG TPA: immunoglobulin domain-containing protein, partial [Bacillota bacterium]|nr:immunoglobulin domain-containing protein [Bacillota bacterium]